MGTFVTISFASTLILSMIAEFRKDERIIHVGDFILFILSIGVFLNLDSRDNHLLFWISLGFISILFGLSLVRDFNNRLKHLLPLLLLPVFVLVDEPLVYGEYSVSFTEISVLIFIALGYLIPQMINLKSMAITRLFGIEKQDVEHAVAPVMLGVLMFLATFFHSTAGIFLVTVGLWSGVVLHKGVGKNLALFSLGMLMVYPFVSLGNLVSVDITLGKTIEGLLFGAFAVLFVVKMATTSRKSILSPIVSIVLVMLLFAFILILGTQKADFGGVDAYISGIYGMSLMFLASSGQEWKSTVFISVLLTGLIVAPLSIDQTTEENQEIVSSSVSKLEVDEKKEIDPFDQKGLDLANIKGNYKIGNENLDFTFELGPKGGRTKGKFKALIGTVKVAEQIENSEFDVKLNVADLTTMNKFRDESLMGAEYFDVAKFPIITFNSKKLTAKSDFYELTGDFTMLGVKKSQIVNVKLVSGTEKGAKPVLIGKGSIDRTLFGMKPDPKEGNVVDFKFTIQLDKID